MTFESHLASPSHLIVGFGHVFTSAPWHVAIDIKGETTTARSLKMKKKKKKQIRRVIKNQ